MMRLYPLTLCLLLFTTGTLASSGDRSNEFQRCLQQCARQSCTADGRPLRALPLALRLTLWTCTDDCKYVCMHTLTDLAAESGVRAQQYYGKWPFWRYAGMQEPAAVAFSLANLLMHVLGLDWLRRGVHPTHPMRHFYITWAYISVNAWIWSAVFHTRGASIFSDFPRSGSVVHLSVLLHLRHHFFLACHTYEFLSICHLMHPDKFFSDFDARFTALRHNTQTRH
jgi:hypothetical protein